MDMIYFIRHAESLANQIDVVLTQKYSKETFKSTEEYLNYKFDPQ
jgi:broad specificity phosphatase PhoE